MGSSGSIAGAGTSPVSACPFTTISHGAGIGTALLAALVDAADNWLQIRRLELTVYVDNAPAIALYRKFGFEVEGTHRDYAFRNGHYVDVLAMARVRVNG